MSLRNQRYLLLLLLALIAERVSIAQFPDYHARLFDENDGIQTTELRKVIKDRKGFIWIMYHDRIQCMDGKQMREFFTGERMISIITDDHDQVWSSSVYNVFRYENDHKGFVKIPFDTAGGVLVGSVFQLPGRIIWLQASNGFYEFEAKSGRFKKIVRAALRFKKAINCRRFSLYGHTIFFDDLDSLYAYDVAKDQRRSLPCLSENRVFHSLSRDSVLVSTWKNLSYWYDFNRGTIQPLDLSSLGVPKNRLFFTVNDLQQIEKNRYLVSTASGLYEMNMRPFCLRVLNIYVKGQPWKGGLYEDIFLDEKKNIHIAFQFGILVFSAYPYQIGLIRNRETEPDKIWHNEARAFAPDGRGNLWLATSQGFAHWDLKENRISMYHAIESAQDRLNFPSVRGIFYDGKYLIVGPTNNGVWLFEPGSGTYRRPVFEKNNKGEATRKKIENDFIREIKKLHSGNYVIIARYGAYLMDQANYMIHEIDFPGKQENIVCSYEDSYKRLWIGTTKGLHCLDSNFSPIASIRTTTHVYALFELSPHDYLLGGFNGLHRISFSAGKLVMREENPYFSKITVAIIAKDKAGKFWLGGKGLYRYDLQTKKIEQFDHADNVQSNSYFNNSFYVRPDGMFFMGGANGINYFYPEKIRERVDTLKLSIVKIAINDDDSSFHPGLGYLRLKHFQNSVQIVYTAPFYGDNSRLQYRYRLEDIDTGWHYNGNNNSIHFSALRAGTYVFRVAASINGIDWFESEQPVHFTILPPFWRTWWFIVAAMVFAIVLITFFIRRRIRFIKEREAQKTELQKLKAEGYHAQLEIEQVINYFTSSLNNHTTIDGILWDIARNCIAQLGFEDCVIYLLDEKTNTLVQKAAWGPKTSDENKILNPIEIRLGKGIVGTVALTGKAERINDTSQDPRYIIDDVQRYSEITVPIFGEGKVIGVIDSEHHQKNFYTDRHMQILATIALHCGARINSLKAEAKTESARMEALVNKQKALEASLQSMRLQMNPHFLFNALNSIQQMILSGEETTATRFLSKFSKLLRLVLTTSDKDQVTLKEELEILQLYIELESLRFKESFAYSLKCSSSVDTEETYVPALFFQPFVENAIWHGLMHKERERKLLIQFGEQTDGALVCTIEDNGIGRQAASLNGSSKPGIHTGKGLSVAYERIRALNEKNGTQSSIRITDLTEQGKSVGTRVSIIIYHGN